MMAKVARAEREEGKSKFYKIQQKEKSHKENLIRKDCERLSGGYISAFVKSTIHHISYNT